MGTGIGLFGTVMVQGTFPVKPLTTGGHSQPPIPLLAILMKMANAILVYSIQTQTSTGLFNTEMGQVLSGINRGGPEEIL